MNKMEIKDSLLFYSLKDVLYNTNTTYVYCNFNLENTDDVLKEMLDTKVICKDGLYHSFSRIDWNTVENYFMFNTYEIEMTLQFIKEKLVGDTELKVFIDVNNDKNITLVNGLIEDLFFDINNVTFYFKER